MAMDSGGQTTPLFGSRHRRHKLQKPPAPSARSDQPQDSIVLPLAAMAGQENKGSLKATREVMVALGIWGIHLGSKLCRLPPWKPNRAPLQ
jgi:hypothetical protein